MLPGQEATQVVAKVKEWSGEFGEISVGHQGGDPIITLALSGIDLDSVLVHVQTEDTPANRRGLLRRLITEQIEAEHTGAIGSEYTLHHVWQGQRRAVDVVFGNIRDPERTPPEVLRAAPGRWRLVVDYPFDDEDRPPSDDVERLRQLRDEGLRSDTVAWVPSLVTAARMDDVGKLVTLDYLLNGSRFDQYSGSLPVADREPARRQLTNQRDSLREQVLGSLRQAYGIDAATDDQLGARVPDGRVVRHPRERLRPAQARRGEPPRCRRSRPRRRARRPLPAPPQDRPRWRRGAARRADGGTRPGPPGDGGRRPDRVGGPRDRHQGAPRGRGLRRRPAPRDHLRAGAAVLPVERRFHPRHRRGRRDRRRPARGDGRLRAHRRRAGPARARVGGDDRPGAAALRRPAGRPGHRHAWRRR